MAQYSPIDFNTVVQTVAGEGANQPPEAQRAIASTILNRHALQGGEIADIASNPKVYNGAKTANARSAVPGSAIYDTIADNIAPVFTDGPTTTATHFHAHMDKAPAWDNGSGTKIGDQTFLDRSDLLRAPAKAPTADELEQHFSAQPPVQPVAQAPLPNVPGYISNPANGPGETGAIPIGGPSADELEQHFGAPQAQQAAPKAPINPAAMRDATQAESAVGALLGKLSGGVDLATPFVQGTTQGFGDEIKGKMAAGLAGARNVVLNALGQPIPYGMKDAEAAAVAAARQRMSALSEAHPYMTTASEVTGGVLPFLAGGEALGAGKAVAEAPTALGKAAQLAGRVIGGGVKGAALGAGGGAVQGFGNAEGSASERAPSALQGAEVGGTLGGVLGAGAPVVAPVVGKVANALGGEVGAGAGAVKQSVTNALGALTGKPMEVKASEYFAEKSPTLQKVRGAFSGPDAAESAVPTPEETRLAQSRVLQLMGAKGMHTDDLRAIPEDLPHTTAEAIGSQGVNHLASLARRSGTTPDMAGTQIAERTRNFGSSILDDFGKASGIQPEEAAGNIDAMVSRLRSDADPMFAAVRSQTGPVWSPDLAKIAERPVVAKAIDAAGKDMLNAGKDPLAVGFKLDPDTGAYTLDSSSLAKTAENQPTAETWDAVRQRLGDQVDRNPLTGKIVPDSESRGNYNINVAKRDLTNILAGDANGNGALIPGYRNALDTSGEYLGLKSAFDRGQSSVLTDKVTARDFAKTFSSLSPADQKAWTAGVANKLYEASQTSRGLTPSLVKSPAFQDKVRTVLGDQADDFLDRLSQRVRLHATGQRIMPGAGSQTTPLLQATGESAPVVDALGNFVKEAAHAKASPGTFLLRHALNANLGDKAANVTETPGYRNAYGRLLLQHPRLTADELREAGREAAKTLPRSRLPVGAGAAYVGGQQGRQ